MFASLCVVGFQCVGSLHGWLVLWLVLTPTGVLGSVPVGRCQIWPTRVTESGRLHAL